MGWSRQALKKNMAASRSSTKNGSVRSDGKKWEVSMNPVLVVKSENIRTRNYITADEYSMPYLASVTFRLS